MRCHVWFVLITILPGVDLTEPLWEGWEELYGEE